MNWWGWAVAGRPTVEPPPGPSPENVVRAATKALLEEVRAEQDQVTVLADQLVAILERVNFAPETVAPPLDDPLDGCDPEIVVLVAYKLAGRLARLQHGEPELAEAAQ